MNWKNHGSFRWDTLKVILKIRNKEFNFSLKTEFLERYYFLDIPPYVHCFQSLIFRLQIVRHLSTKKWSVSKVLVSITSIQHWVLEEGSRRFCSVACAAGAESCFWCGAGLRGLRFGPFDTQGPNFSGTSDSVIPEFSLGSPTLIGYPGTLSLRC